mgnify:FL=1
MPNSKPPKTPALDGSHLPDSHPMKHLKASDVLLSPVLTFMGVGGAPLRKPEPLANVELVKSRTATASEASLFRRNPLSNDEQIYPDLSDFQSSDGLKNLPLIPFATGKPPAFRAPPAKGLCSTMEQAVTSRQKLIKN